MTTLVHRIRSRCSYANVTATMALVFALSGGAYATATLPRDSVGAEQVRAGAIGTSELRTGAVRSRDVQNRTLEVRDLSRRARRSLRGSSGPVGPAGPTGPAGPPAVTFRAAISVGGDPVAGNATGASHSVGSNEYRVTFAREVASCIPVATLATVPASGAPDPPPGRITVAASGNTVLVRTFDAAGAPVATSFTLVVAC